MFGLSSLTANLVGAGVLVAALGGGALYLHHRWYTEGANDVQVKWNAYIVDQNAKTAKLGADIASDWAKNLEVQNAKLDTITARYNDTASKLRASARSNARLAGAAARTCQGSTGAELSRPDAGFLNWQAARAEKLRTRLGACFDKIDELQLRLNPTYKAPAYLPDEPVPDFTK